MKNTGGHCDAGLSARVAPWMEFTRFRLSPTAISNAWLGVALVGANESRPLIGSLLAVGGVAWLLYLFGMGQNDFADRTVDREKHSTRPLPSGRLASRAAARFLTLASVSAAAIGFSISLTTGLATLWILGWTTAYNTVTKDHAIAGPACMGVVRGSLIILGGTVAGSPWTYDHAIGAAGLFGYVFLLTRHSLAEDEAPRATLTRRAQYLRLWVGALGIATIARRYEVTDSIPWLGLAGWLLAVGFVSYAIRPSRESPPRPFMTTLRLLVGLLVLDMAMALTYDRPYFGLASVAWWLLTLRARRS